MIPCICLQAKTICNTRQIIKLVEVILLLFIGLMILCHIDNANGIINKNRPIIGKLVETGISIKK
jgi:hypothetical protein